MIVRGEGSGIMLGLRAEYGRKEHRKRQSAIRKEYDDFNGEYQVSHTFKRKGLSVTLRGRPDAVYQENHKTVVEEIKTIAVNKDAFKQYTLESFPGFKCQLDLYGYLLHLNGLGDIHSRLFLVNIADEEERVFDYIPDFSAVAENLDTLLGRIGAEVQRVKQRRLNLAQNADTLPFPYPDLRLNQDKMMEAIRASVQTGGRLMLSSPTGSGKTAGVLFPALVESFKQGKKVFFATARTTQRRAVMEFVLRIKAEGADFSALFLTARAKLCPLKEEVCLWEECPYIADFANCFAGLGLFQEMDEGAILTGEEIRERISALRLCPFAASLALAERADLVVGDFNYVFDPAVSLKNLFLDGGAENYILIIDEAHNLPARIRERFSPSLSEADAWQILLEIRNKGFRSEIYREIAALMRKIIRFVKEHSENDSTEIEPSVIAEIHSIADKLAMGYYLHLTRTGIDIQGDPILPYLRELIWFCKVAEIGSEGFAINFDHKSNILKIHCLDSGRVLKDFLKDFYSVTAMSATLHPAEFFAHSLGLPETTEHLALPNPFPAENRSISLAANVSTRYNVRKQFHKPIAEIIDRVYEAHPGRYFCYFPSFDYLETVSQYLRSPYKTQQREMPEAEREKFISEIMNGDEKQLLLAALGGIFAEGVDFPGRLEGVIVVGPGLPLFCAETELQRQYFDQQFGTGFEYAYVFPGMNRVVQAAGRLIRSETDRGVIVLIGARFNQEPYRSLIPRDWFVEHPSELVSRNLKQDLTDFWNRL